MRKALGVVAVLIIGAPLLAAGPASAAPPQSVTGRQVSMQGSGRSTDPTCPWSSDGIGPAGPEARETWQAVYHSAAGQETLYASACWINTTANGGDGANGGDWTIARDGGTLTGTLKGGESSNIDFSFTLTVHRGTGNLRGLSGSKLYLWWCRVGGGIRLTPKTDWRACAPQ